MSPYTVKAGSNLVGFPRTRGDEPKLPGTLELPALVFPARAGMSPDGRYAVLERIRFPRTRGDEPNDDLQAQPPPRFSPHARG